MMRVLKYVPWTHAWRRRRDELLCMQTAQKLQQIVDGELPPSAANATLLRHLEACARCSSEAQAYQDLKRAIARVGGAGDDDLVERLRRLARELCDQEQDGPREG